MNTRLVDCKFFLTSECKKGQSCRYRHCLKAKLTDKNDVCCDWLNGKCNSFSCPHRHPQYDFICKHIIYKGFCSKNDQCSFTHPSKEVIEATNNFAYLKQLEKDMQCRATITTPSLHNSARQQMNILSTPFVPNKYIEQMEQNSTNSESRFQLQQKQKLFSFEQSSSQAQLKSTLRASVSDFRAPQEQFHNIWFGEPLIAANELYNLPFQNPTTPKSEQGLLFDGSRNDVLHTDLFDGGQYFQQNISDDLLNLPLL